MRDPTQRPTRGRHSDGETTGASEPPSPPEGGAVPDLQLAIVEYDESPNRGTIHPPGLMGMERMETWLSVDLSVVIDLSAWR